MLYMIRLQAFCSGPIQDNQKDDAPGYGLYTLLPHVSSFLTSLLSPKAGDFTAVDFETVNNQ